jgi:RNA polymerase sigma factor (sigma-70 family)
LSEQQYLYRENKEGVLGAIDKAMVNARCNTHQPKPWTIMNQTNTFLFNKTTHNKFIDWDKLFREQAPRLKGICRRYVGDESLAEDLVQEAFVLALNKIDTYSNRGAIDGGLRKKAIKNPLQYLRNKQATVPIETISIPIEQEPAMENSNNKIRFAIEKASFSTNELLEVIDRLPVHHKTVFNLYVIDGFSHKQIAQMLRISPGTSKSHLARARKKTQELLYTKAIGQQITTPRRRYLPLVLLFSPNYIDRVFRKGLLNYQVPVGSPTMAFPSAVVSGLNWGASFAGKILIGGLL